MMLAILAAMHREISLTKKVLDAKPTNKHSLNQISIGNRHGVDIIFATVGIGGIDIETILPILVNEYFVTDVLVIGYAGSTVKSINPGDLILCTEACRIRDQIITNATSSYSSVISDPNLVSKLEATLVKDQTPFYKGKIGTLSRIVSDTQTKRALGERFELLAIDMETFVIGDAVSRYGLAFSSVRAITDPIDMGLPDLTGLFDSYGQVSTQRWFKYTLGHLTDLRHFPALGWNARKANNVLSDFVVRFLSNY